MLVLTAQPVKGENKIFIGDNIEVIVLSVDRRSGQVRLGFNAPGHQVDRAKLREDKNKTHGN